MHFSDRFAVGISHSTLAHSDNVLGLGSCASSMSGIGMTTELELLARRQLQYLLESCSNLHQRILATSLSGRSCPQSDSVETLSNIDDYAHNLVVSLLLESLSNSSELSMEPEFVDVDQFLVLELVRPLATMLVLLVFPFWSNTLLEKMVVGLDC